MCVLVVLEHHLEQEIFWLRPLGVHTHCVVAIMGLAGMYLYVITYSYKVLYFVCNISVFYVITCKYITPLM